MIVPWAAAIRKIEFGLRRAFAQVKEELDDHRESINRNEDELQSLYEVVGSLEDRLDELAARIDLATWSAQERRISPLSEQEKLVFSVLFSSDEPLALGKLAEVLSLPVADAALLVGRLVMKGVPLMQQEVRGDIMVSMELRFKELQRRHQLIPLAEGGKGSFSSLSSSISYTDKFD